MRLITRNLGKQTLDAETWAITPNGTDWNNSPTQLEQKSRFQKQRSFGNCLASEWSKIWRRRQLKRSWNPGRSSPLATSNSTQPRHRRHEAALISWSQENPSLTISFDRVVHNVLSLRFCWTRIPLISETWGFRRSNKRQHGVPSSSTDGRYKWRRPGVYCLWMWILVHSSKCDASGNDCVLIVLTLSQTGQIVRWSIFLGIIFLIAAYMGFGYWHAKRRITKGLPPMKYHRVCVRTWIFWKLLMSYSGY